MVDLEEKKPASPLGKGPVDRWQVLGGMAGVASLVLTALGGIKETISLWVIAGVLGIAAACIGVVLLHRWGKSGAQQTSRRFIAATAVTLVGAATVGLSGGIIFRPDGGAPPAGNAEILRQEQLTIHRGQYVNLDSTSRDKGIMDGSKPGAGADLGFYGSTVTSGRAEPKSIAVGSNLVSRDDCSGTTVMEISFTADRLEEGYTFCVKTTEGRWARMAVMHRRPSENAENDQIDFKILVWSQR